MNKGGTLSIRRISDHSIFLICRKRAAQAGIATFSPHDMPRTYIGDLLDAGPISVPPKSSQATPR